MLQCSRRLGSFALPQRLWRGDVLRCVDLHCGGEPATVVVDGGGFDQVRGANMFEKRRDVMARLDHWREVLLHEPRGYPCANADFLVPHDVLPLRLHGGARHIFAEHDRGRLAAAVQVHASQDVAAPEPLGQRKRARAPEAAPAHCPPKELRGWHPIASMA